MIDTSTIAALVQQLREDDASIRRIEAHFARPGADWPDCGHDETSCPCFENNDRARAEFAAAVLRSLGGLATTADTLEALQREVDRIPDLKAAIGYEIDRRDHFAAERDAALRRVAKLEAALAWAIDEFRSRRMVQTADRLKSKASP